MAGVPVGFVIGDITGLVVVLGIDEGGDVFLGCNEGFIPCIGFVEGVGFVICISGGVSSSSPKIKST